MPDSVWIYGFVGSPLYIALYLKRYEEAARILETNPLSVKPGYAALPVTLHYRKMPEMLKNQKTNKMRAKPEITYHVDKAIYLEDLVLLDKNIPDELFCALCAELAKRRQTELIDLPCRSENHVFKKESSLDKGIAAVVSSCPPWGFWDHPYEFPAIILELPMWHDLKKAYGLQETYDEQQVHGAKKEPAGRKSYEGLFPDLDEALNDLTLYWKSMKGLYRLKTLDESLYRTWVDEHVAAHLFLRFVMLVCNLIVLAGEHNLLEAPSPGHVRELRIPVNVQEQFARVKKTMQKLGYASVSADQFWDAIMNFEYGVSNKTNAAWLGYEMWKDVFGQKMVFTVEASRRPDDMESWQFERYSDSERDARGIELLNALLNFEGRRNVYPYTVDFLGDFAKEKEMKPEYDLPKSRIKDAKIFLGLLDWIRWEDKSGQESERESFRDHRRAMAKAVLQSGDRELLLMCMEKNVFPAEDAEFLYKTLQENPQAGDSACYPMLIMKKHGCLGAEET